MKRPKICIPITDVARDEIIAHAKEFANTPAELVEWRIDFFEGSEEEIVCIVEELKQILAEKQLIVTLRTEEEGGESNGSRFDYPTCLLEIVKTGVPDYVDVEIRRDTEMVKRIIASAKKSSTKVIGSYHDFEKTPMHDEIIATLEEAMKLGADIGKFACMPSSDENQGKADAEMLLKATEDMKKRYPEYPIITMSMGEHGKVTRLYGGLYGSEVTFGCVGVPSAPGQIELEQMKEVFDKLYSGKRHISLIGFMGVGKSTISCELHRQTNRSQFDTDQMIVEQEGCSISEIFSNKGEAYFRQLETNLIDELGLCSPGIISCGGGMALRDINVKKLHALGEVVLLTAKPETIYERVRHSTDRPLLNGNMNVPHIRNLMEERCPFYEKAATLTVSTDGKTAQQIASEILDLCQ